MCGLTLWMKDVIELTLWMKDVIELTLGVKDVVEFLSVTHSQKKKSYANTHGTNPTPGR